MHRIARLTALTSLLTLLLAGCAAAATPQPTPAPAVLPSESAPIVIVVTATPLPTPTPSAISEVASPTPASRFAGLRMADLAARQYGGSGIVVGQPVKREKYFVQYTMRYESDGLTITGLIDIPISEGPFPVVIVNHGYLRPVEYQSGFDSWRMADWLASRGYIAIMPDYRNYGGSDQGPNPFHIGYAIDVMNLIAQIDSLPQAIPQQIGLLGHSMGGEISMWPMILSDEVDAVVLYASMSGDLVRNWEHAWRYWDFQRDAMEATALVYGNPTDDPQAFEQISPLYFLDQVRMPVMIHHGTMDESVPYWWSEELYELMQDAGIDVTFWPYPGGRHGLGGRGLETLMQRSYQFFEENVRGNVNTPGE